MRDFMRDEIKKSAVFGETRQRRRKVDMRSLEVARKPRTKVGSRQESGNTLQFPIEHGIFLADHPPLALLSAPLTLLTYLSLERYFAEVEYGRREERRPRAAAETGEGRRWEECETRPVNDDAVRPLSQC